MMNYIRDDTVKISEKNIVSPEKIRGTVLSGLGSVPRPRANRRRAVRVLLAAAAAVAVLSLSAAAVASRIPSTAEMLGTDSSFGPTMSEVGLSDSAEYQAALEWQQHLDEWYKTGKNMFTADDVWDIYAYYGANSQEARNTLDSLVKKYKLKLHSELYTQVSSIEELYTAAGAEGFMPEMDSFGKFDLGGSFPLSGQFYDDGSFSFNCSAALPGGSHVLYSFNSFAKGIFHRDPHVIIRDLSGLDEWNYTTNEGVEVMLALGSYQAIMAANLENCFVFVLIHSGEDNDSSGHDSAGFSFGEPTVSRADLEAFADNFSLLTIDALCT